MATGIVLKRPEGLKMYSLLTYSVRDYDTTDYKDGDILDIDGRGKEVTRIGNAYENIICDTREPATIRDAFSVTATLHGGDFLWLSRSTHQPVIVERKQLSTGELLSSLFRPSSKGLVESKLTTQCKKMGHLPDAQKFLMIEMGEFDVDSFTGHTVLPNTQGSWKYKWESVQKAIRSLCITWNIYPWYAAGYGGTFDSLDAIRDSTNKSFSSTQRHVSFDPANVPYSEEIGPQVQVLCCADGIGPENAKRILMNFGSLANLMTATLEELTSIEGIGPTRAETLYNLFNFDGEVREANE